MTPPTGFELLPKKRKPAPPAHRSAGRTALRWLVGACVFALLAGTSRMVGTAFADLGRDQAQARALEASLRRANAAVGANLGPRWRSVIDTPAGARALAGWFDALDHAWPGVCAAEMLAIGQSGAACLPVPQTLGPLLDAHLGADAYATLATLRSAQANGEPDAPEPPAPLPRFEPAAAVAAAPPRAAPMPMPSARAAPFDDGSAYIPPRLPPAQAEALMPEPMGEQNASSPQTDPASQAVATPPPTEPKEGDAGVAAALEREEGAIAAMVSPPGFEPGTY